MKHAETSKDSTNAQVFKILAKLLSEKFGFVSHRVKDEKPSGKSHGGSNHVQRSSTNR